MQALLLFENLPFGIAIYFVADRSIPFGRHSCFISVMKKESFYKNLLLFTAIRPALTFTSPENNKMKLKSDLNLCNQMFAKAKKFVS